MKTTILNINNVSLYVPFENVGVVSICNSKDGNEFACLVNGLVDERKRLEIGDKIEITLISFSSDSERCKFCIPNFLKKDCNPITHSSTPNQPEGFEVTIGKHTLCMPFITDGVVSIMITLNKGKALVNIGGLTSENILLDYYCSKLNIGDSITISLKNLSQVSMPIRKRRYSSN